MNIYFSDIGWVGVPLPRRDNSRLYNWIYRLVQEREDPDGEEGAD